MRKILIIEDDMNRMELFQNELMNGENIIFHTKDVDAAYDALVKEGDIDVIMFDNDLGTGNDGKNLAQLIQRDFFQEEMEYPRNIRTTIVHSMNTPAAISIREIMEDISDVTYQTPFSALNDEPGTLGQMINV